MTKIDATYKIYNSINWDGFTLSCTFPNSTLGDLTSLLENHLNTKTLTKSETKLFGHLCYLQGMAFKFADSQKIELDSTYGKILHNLIK